MPSPNNAASGTTTAANSHGPAVGVQAVTDPLAALSATRESLEASSGFWATFLVVASIVVAIGVILEFAEDVVEIFDSVKNKQKISFRKQAVFLGTLLVIGGVTAEFVAEENSSGIETKLRANNAAAEGVLDKRANDTTKEAVDTANKFGGLHQFVIDQNLKADSALKQLNTDRIRLEEARAAANIAIRGAEKTLAEAKAEIKYRTLSPAQIEAISSDLGRFPGAIANVWYSVTTSADAPALMFEIRDALNKANWKTSAYIQLYSSNVRGVLVRIRIGAPASAERAAQALAVDLNNNGIKAGVEFFRAGTAVQVAGAPAPDIDIVVGPTPE